MKTEKHTEYLIQIRSINNLWWTVEKTSSLDSAKDAFLLWQNHLLSIKTALIWRKCRIVKETVTKQKKVVSL